MIAGPMGRQRSELTTSESMGTPCALTEAAATNNAATASRLLLIAISSRYPFLFAAWLGIVSRNGRNGRNVSISAFQRVTRKLKHHFLMFLF
jgi:hypothetical protein